MSIKILSDVLWTYNSSIDIKPEATIQSGMVLINEYSTPNIIEISDGTSWLTLGTSGNSYDKWIISDGTNTNDVTKSKTIELLGSTLIESLINNDKLTISHKDVSFESTTNNNGGSYISGVTLNSSGHVEKINTETLPLYDSLEADDDWLDITNNIISHKSKEITVIDETKDIIISILVDDDNHVTGYTKGELTRNIETLNNNIVGSGLNISHKEFVREEILDETTNSNIITNILSNNGHISKIYYKPLTTNGTQNNTSLEGTGLDISHKELSLNHINNGDDFISSIVTNSDGHVTEMTTENFPDGVIYEGDNGDINVSSNIISHSTHLGVDYDLGLLYDPDTDTHTFNVVGSIKTNTNGHLDTFTTSDISNSILLLNKTNEAQTILGSIIFEEDITLNKNLLVYGDLDVKGTITSVDATEIHIGENKIELNAELQDSLPINGEYQVHRGYSTWIDKDNIGNIQREEAKIIWNEASKSWMMNDSNFILREIATKDSTFVTSYSSLTDVELDNLLNNNIALYNSGTEIWENKTVDDLAELISADKLMNGSFGDNSLSTNNNVSSIGFLQSGNNSTSGSVRISDGVDIWELTIDNNGILSTSKI